MEQKIKILHLEDNLEDAELINAELRKEDFEYEYQLVQSKEEFENSLRSSSYNVIVSDYSFPSYDGDSALKTAKKVSPEIPFIFVSGTMGEEFAIKSLVSGATDYILKHNMKRLGAAVKRAFEEYNIKKEKNKAEKAFKKSEKKYRELFEHATVGIYRSTIEGKITMANPAMIKMLGYSSLEDLLNVDLTGLYAADKDRARLLDEIKQNSKVSGFECELLGASNNPIPLSINARAEIDSDGAIEFIEGFVENIEKRKAAERVILIAKEKAEKSEKLKTEFLSQMSHEIRTPLNTILNFSQLIYEDTVDLIDKETKAYFDMVKSAGGRILRTINLFLDMSELQAGTYEADLFIFDIHNDVLKELINEFQPTVKEKELRLNLIKKTDSAVIEGDKYSISQIFANLIDNAIKFTHKGKIEVIIHRDEQERLAVDVCDTGIGIAEEYIPSMFEPFTQEDQGYSRKFEGNGLGLALVRKYCDINNALLTVETEKNKGTKFRITFQPYK